MPLQRVHMTVGSNVEEAAELLKVQLEYEKAVDFSESIRQSKKKWCVWGWGISTAEATRPPPVQATLDMDSQVISAQN